MKRISQIVGIGLIVIVPVLVTGCGVSNGESTQSPPGISEKLPPAKSKEPRTPKTDWTSVDSTPSSTDRIYKKCDGQNLIYAAESFNELVGISVIANSTECTP